MPRRDDEYCSCHISPPCSFCVDGSRDYQEALSTVEDLDNDELERLSEDIANILQKRQKLKVASLA